MEHEIETKLKELVDAEFNELKEDIVVFRDLEREYATKLTEEKLRMAEQLKEELAVLATRLERFCLGRLTMELSRYQALTTEKQEKINTTKLMANIVDQVINGKFEGAEISFRAWIRAYLQEKTNE